MATLLKVELFKVAYAKPPSPLFFVLKKILDFDSGYTKSHPMHRSFKFNSG